MRLETVTSQGNLKMIAGRMTTRFQITGLVSIPASLAGREAAGNEPARPESRPDTADTNGVVAAAHPPAARAGLETLRQCGNAVDAAMATAVSDAQQSGCLDQQQPEVSLVDNGGFL